MSDGRTLNIIYAIKMTKSCVYVCMCVCVHVCVCVYVCMYVCVTLCVYCSVDVVVWCSSNDFNDLKTTITQITRVCKLGGDCLN